MTLILMATGGGAWAVGWLTLDACRALSGRLRRTAGARGDGAAATTRLGVARCEDRGSVAP